MDEATHNTELANLNAPARLLHSIASNPVKLNAHIPVQKLFKIYIFAIFRCIRLISIWLVIQVNVLITNVD